MIAALLTESERRELARFRDLRTELDKLPLTREVVEAKLKLRSDLSTFGEELLEALAPRVRELEEAPTEPPRGCLCASWELDHGCTCHARDHR